MLRLTALVIVFIVALVVFAYPAVPVAYSAPLTQATAIAPQIAVILNDANLRDGPGTTFAIVGGIQTGQVVTITGQDATGDWYQLEDDQWIFSDLVQVQTVTLPTITPTPVLSPTVKPGRIVTSTPRPTPTRPTPTPTPTRIRPILSNEQESIVKGGLAYYQNIRLFTELLKQWQKNGITPKWKNDMLLMANSFDTLGRAFSVLYLPENADLGYLRSAGISMVSFARGYRLWLSTDNHYHLNYANSDLDEASNAMEQGLTMLGLMEEVNARYVGWLEENKGTFTP